MYGISTSLVKLHAVCKRVVSRVILRLSRASMDLSAVSTKAKLLSNITIFNLTGDSNNFIMATDE